jgi:hypothetical protein
VVPKTDWLSSLKMSKTGHNGLIFLFGKIEKGVQKFLKLILDALDIIS